MQTTGASHDGGISLPELVHILRSGKWYIVAITAACTLAAAAASWYIGPEYSASVIVAPNASGPGEGSLSSLDSVAGGLAALAGLSLSGDTKKTESVAVLQSDALTENFIQNNDLLPVLYANSWDSRNRRWTVTDPRKIPTLWRANQRFKDEIRTVKTDARTGLVTLTIRWRDPKMAAAWANGLVKMTNDYMRSKVIRDSERNIEFLDHEAAKTSLIEARRAVYSLMRAEMHKAMLARGSEEYGLKVIDPAIGPEKTSAQKITWPLTGFAAGLLLSAFLVILRTALE
jgi:uncharacterized protein involved in exopolysaccharide biosynthesis